MSLVRWYVCGALLRPLAVALVAASCVGTFGAHGTWLKPGADPDVIRRDAYECEREAAVRRTGDAPADVLYERCMRARGYVRPGEAAATPPR
ncbi:MAG: hypothetical protein HYR51_16630 [Candidatus Rokubacteria bacterium]|nr:hypothetical protein [Candidatus Rokubacteria bacterium]